MLRSLIIGSVLAVSACGSQGSPTTPSANIVEVSGTPNPALQTATMVHFTFTGDVPTSSMQRWDFGDGATVTNTGSPGVDVSHVYDTPGMFTVRLTITNSGRTQATKETTITVKTLTGLWKVSINPTSFGLNGALYDFVQSGATFTGRFLSPPGGTVAGVVRNVDPHVTFMHNAIIGSTPSGWTFTLANGNPSADILQGVFNGLGFTNTPMELTRQ